MPNRRSGVRRRIRTRLTRRSFFLPSRGRPVGTGASPRCSEGGPGTCHSFGWCLVFKGKHQAEGKIMRVFVTGATGALGRHLVPGLVMAGHEVTAATRTPGKVDRKSTRLNSSH